jgi:hypothetical protein
MTGKKPRALSVWGCAFLSLVVLSLGLIQHRWFVIAIALVGFTAVLVFIFFSRRPLPPPQPTILSTPRITVLSDVLTVLSSIGVAVGAALVAEGATELDLVRKADLQLDYDDPTTGIERLKAASAGLLTTNELLALRYDYELRAVDRLPYLNSQVPPEKGRFYYTPDETHRSVVFLSPAQVHALSARGWLFGPPPAVSDLGAIGVGP